MGNRCIVVFVKCPEKGKVKSRLSSQLDGELVVTLYESFVVDLLATLEKTGIPYRIAFSPAEGEREIVRRFGCRNVIPQIGADLGERMKNAFDGCFAEGFDEVDLVVKPELVEGVAVKIIDGPLRGVNGIIEKRKGKV